VSTICGCENTIYLPPAALVSIQVEFSNLLHFNMQKSIHQADLSFNLYIYQQEKHYRRVHNAKVAIFHFNVSALNRGI